MIMDNDTGRTILALFGEVLKNQVCILDHLGEEYVGGLYRDRIGNVRKQIDNIKKRLAIDKAGGPTNNKSNWNTINGLRRENKKLKDEIHRLGEKLKWERDRRRHCR